MSSLNSHDLDIIFAKRDSSGSESNAPSGSVAHVGHKVSTDSSKKEGSIASAQYAKSDFELMHSSTGSSSFTNSSSKSRRNIEIQINPLKLRKQTFFQEENKIEEHR